ncbi:plexin-B2b [Neolamprologus brichardi]|uniref:plexin-B2b n=1 Tax=Neolamprologus brichardi TaxID=32507 RepID=UPI001643C6B6|nr:plexin-B2b [Neolamprologus brichardi]
MASWVSILLFLFWLSVSQAQGGSGKIPTVEFISESLINNVVQDPQTGRIYLGAVNNIFQLSPSLQKEARTETGPKKDAKTCTPPASGCQDTVLMPNSNKLLLVHPSNGSLIVCGSRYRGICSLLNLSNVEQELYYNDNKGQRTYVASIEDNVNVVSVMSNYTKNGRTFKVFLVGKGYGSLDSTKLISTRILEDYQDWVVFENIIEASAVQTAPFVLKYLHDFQHAFKEDGFVYFLFSRTLDGTDNKNLTYVSRLCENDQHYYSYTELQLTCGIKNRYNKVQAAYVAFPGKELARVMSQSGNYGTVTSFTKVLFMVAHPDDDESDSALCMYPLNSINQQLMDIISACYSDSGEISGVPAVDVPYSSQTYTACLSNLAKDALGNFKCGAEHLPSPLASKPAFALKADAVLTMSVHLTAVTVAVENDHTIAFLGSANGEVFKVHLRPGEYGNKPYSYVGNNIGDKVNKNLFLDQSQSHLYITTEKRILLEVTCTRRSECRRAEEKNGWLWSPKQQCVKIVSFSPSKCMSCVSSQWGCQWNTQDHTCSDADNSVVGSHIIKHRQSANCPLFENPDPVLIPVGYKTRISFEGINLKHYQGHHFTIGSELMTKEEDVSFEGGPFYTFSGFNIPATFRFVENPTVQDHQPKASFVCGGRNIVVTGSGFDIIQTAIMKVQGSNWSASELAHEKNDTVIQFQSPTVNGSLNQHLKTVIKLDNWEKELKPFHYHPNPSFNNLQNKIITANSMIIVTGRGFSKAMTTKEAQAFVGDVQCVVNTLQDDKLFLEPPSTTPGARTRAKHQHRETGSEDLELMIKFGKGEWVVDSVQYEKKNDFPLYIIIPAVIVPMLLIITISVYCYRRKSQQAEREYEKVKHQLENLEESVRDRCKKEFTDLMIEMEDHTNDLNEGRIPFLDYKTYTDRVFFLPSKDGANDVMITGKLDIPEARKATVIQSLNQFSNLLNSKTFLINFIRTLERSHDFNARAKVYFASLLTVALHGKLEYYTDIMRTLLLELMEEYVNSKNPKLMLRRSETVVERMLCNWMSICLYQFLKDSAGEPLYKLFKAIKHQIEKGPVDVRVKKAKYTLNDTGLLGDDVEYSVLTLQVLVQGEGPDVTPVKVLNCDTISQVKEKIIEQVYRNLPYSQRPKVDSVTLEWRPGSTGQILSDLDLTSQKEGRWKRINTLAHYNVRDNATLVLSKVQHTQQNYDQNQENHEERNALLEDDKVFHLVRPTDELDETKSKRGSIKDKSMTKAITEIYLTRLLSVKGTLQQFVDDFFRSVLCSGAVVPPAVKYFFDFLDEQALKHNNVDEETIHIWKTNSLPLRFWVNILKNPHFIFDVHVSEVVDASLSVIAQTFMDACTKSEHKLSRDSPSNKLLYAKEISTYKKMVDDYYKGIRQMVSVSDQDMNTHLAEVSRSHTDKLNTHVALHQLYQYASKYYDGIIASLEEDPAAQSKQLALRLQQIAAALENKVTDL